MHKPQESIPEKRRKKERLPHIRGAILGVLMAGGVAQGQDGPTEEQKVAALRTANAAMTERNKALSVENQELEKMVTEVWTQLAAVPGRPEKLFADQDQHTIAPETMEWIGKTLPREHLQLLTDLTSAQEALKNAPKGSHLWYHHWQTVILIVLAILASILAIPPVGVGVGHAFGHLAIHGGLTIGGSLLRRIFRRRGPTPPPLPPVDSDRG